MIIKEIQREKEYKNFVIIFFMLKIFYFKSKFHFYELTIFRIMNIIKKINNFTKKLAIIINSSIST